MIPQRPDEHVEMDEVVRIDGIKGGGVLFECRIILHTASPDKTICRRTHRNMKAALEQMAKNYLDANENTID